MFITTSIAPNTNIAPLNTNTPNKGTVLVVSIVLIASTNFFLVEYDDLLKNFFSITISC